MELTGRLTHLQKKALEGEIAYILGTSPHNAEIKFRTYILLSELNEDDKPIALEIIKSLVKIDESEIDKLYLEAINPDTVPLWLWIEKSIADIKEALSFSENYSRSDVKLDKKDCRKKIIESSFILFARKALIVSPTAAYELCKEIINTKELEFLEASCFYIMQTCQEFLREKEETIIDSNIMNCLFDFRERLSYKIENQSLSLYSKPSDMKIPVPFDEFIKKFVESDNCIVENLNPKETDTEIEIHHFNIKGLEEITTIINKEMQKQLNKNTCKKSVKNPTYIVKKVFNNAQNQDIVLKECKTRQEGEQFIKEINKEFPELLRTCSFTISETNKESKP